MKNIKILIYILLFSCSNMVFAQSIEIERIVTTNYPTLRAEFRVKDGSGKEVRNLSDLDFDLKDLGITTPFTSPNCPPDQSRFSLILIFDASGSMDNNISDESSNPPSRHTVIKNVAKQFIDQLPEGQFECAIGVFSKEFDYNQLLRFTTDKDSLKKATDYRLINATNYNAGFLGYNENDEGGAFGLVKDAQYKPVIIFMTDGYHQENQKHGAIKDGLIIQKALATNTTIYSLAIGPTAPDPTDTSLDPNSKAKLESISRATGGEYYENLLSEEKVSDIYSQILQSAKGFGTPAPCYIDFVSDCNDGEIEITYFGFNPSVTDKLAYIIPENLKPNLNITERSFLEINQTLNVPKQFDVRLTAEKNQMEITGFNASPANIFTVSDWGGSAPPFTLNKDESRIIKVSIKPENREFYGGTINFEGTGCSGLSMTPRTGFIFAEDIVFSNVNQGDQEKKTFTKRFCNLTDEPLNINSIIVSGGANQSDFGVTGQTKTLDPGDCIDIEATFRPTDQGDREALYTVKTNKGDFEAKLKGGGAGKPQIAATAARFEDVNCVNPKSTITVVVRNDGPVELDITNIALEDATNFTYTGPSSLKVAPNSTNNVDVTVDFTPQANGVQTTNLIFTNNSDDNEYKVKLEGEMLAVEYNVSEPNHNFGEICGNLGNPTTKTFTLSNVSSFGYNVIASSNLPEFKTDKSSYDLSSGTAVVTISFESNVNNTYNGVISLTSECGNINRTINVTGSINSPEVQSQAVSIAAVIGTAETSNVDITNPNSAPYDVVDAYVGDASKNPIPEFNVSATNFTVPGSGTYKLDITYTPNANSPVDKAGILYLVVNKPCNVTLDNINVEGKPTLSIANLSIADDNKDYIGRVTKIPVTLNGQTGFLSSGTNSVEFTVEFDEALLSPTNGTLVGTNQVSHKFNLNSPFTGTQTYNMEFKVLNGLPLQSTTLNFIKAEALNNSGSQSAGLNTDNGQFDLILVKGEATSEDLSASPGENFNLPVFILDENDNLDEQLHKDLRIVLQYNYTVMQPVDRNHAVVSDDIAELDITGEIKFSQNKKVNKTQSQFAFATIPMVAKLGNKKVTKIAVKSVDVLSGGVADFVLDTNDFTLTGVCEEGGHLRLFTLSEIEPSIKLTQNPIVSNTSIEVSTVENGIHSVSVFDMIGNKINLDNRIIASEGSYSVPFEIESLNTGYYLIFFQTPTQEFYKKIAIIK
ncbi:MAG: choice-of-anchor D domain-containing protein [Candidatus Kapaibacterium sp.]|nr:choice-of-anchor D domain-containing protein [Ignavibacteriota bacterium]MCB9220198.1 choice-of-anchor D domain-containing protein [Ignavibacteria bacterium]